MTKAIGKRQSAYVLAVSLMASLLPASAWAAKPPGDLCEHHPVHTAECGYSEGTGGTPCGHEHTDECYTTVKSCGHNHGQECYPQGNVSENEATPSNADRGEATECTHVCSEESGCITKELNCKHAHDEDCGYSPAAEGTPCTYVCEICTPQDGGQPEDKPQTGGEAAASSDALKLTVDEVQAMVDALPSPEELKDMDEDEKREVYGRFQSALDAFEALTEEEQAAVGTERAEKLERLGEAFNQEVAVQQDEKPLYIVNIPEKLVAGGDEESVTIKPSDGNDSLLIPEGGKVRVYVYSGGGQVGLSREIGLYPDTQNTLWATLRKGKDGDVLGTLDNVAVWNYKGEYIEGTKGKLYLDEPNYTPQTPRDTYNSSFDLEVQYIDPQP